MKHLSSFVCFIYVSSLFHLTPAFAVIANESVDPTGIVAATVRGVYQSQNKQGESAEGLDVPEEIQQTLTGIGEFVIQGNAWVERKLESPQSLADQVEVRNQLLQREKISEANPEDVRRILDVLKNKFSSMKSDLIANNASQEKIEEVETQLKRFEDLGQWLESNVGQHGGNPEASTSTGDVISNYWEKAKNYASGFWGSLFSTEKKQETKPTLNPAESNPAHNATGVIDPSKPIGSAASSPGTPAAPKPTAVIFDSVSADGTSRRVISTDQGSTTINYKSLGERWEQFSGVSPSLVGDMAAASFTPSAAGVTYTPGGYQQSNGSTVIPIQSFPSSLATSEPKVSSSSSPASPSTVQPNSNLAAPNKDLNRKPPSAPARISEDPNQAVGIASNNNGRAPSVVPPIAIAPSTGKKFVEPDIPQSPVAETNRAVSSDRTASTSNVDVESDFVGPPAPSSDLIQAPKSNTGSKTNTSVAVVSNSGSGSGSGSGSAGGDTVSTTTTVTPSVTRSSTSPSPSGGSTSDAPTFNNVSQNFVGPSLPDLPPEMRDLHEQVQRTTAGILTGTGGGGSGGNKSSSSDFLDQLTAAEQEHRCEEMLRYGGVPYLPEDLEKCEEILRVPTKFRKNSPGASNKNTHRVCTKTVIGMGPWGIPRFAQNCEDLSEDDFISSLCDTGPYEDVSKSSGILHRDLECLSRGSSPSNQFYKLAYDTTRVMAQSIEDEAESFGALTKEFEKWKNKEIDINAPTRAALKEHDKLSEMLDQPVSTQLNCVSNVCLPGEQESERDKFIKVVAQKLGINSNDSQKMSELNSELDYFIRQLDGIPLADGRTQGGYVNFALDQQRLITSKEHNIFLKSTLQYPGFGISISAAEKVNLSTILQNMIDKANGAIETCAKLTDWLRYYIVKTMDQLETVNTIHETSRFILRDDNSGPERVSLLSDLFIHYNKSKAKFKENENGIFLNNGQLFREFYSSKASGANN